MSRGLSVLVVLVLLLALGTAQLKMTRDATATLKTQQEEPRRAPPPLAPGGLDGRPLDNNIAISPEKGPPKFNPGGKKSGKGPRHGRPSQGRP